jgi:hypothetical protein
MTEAEWLACEELGQMLGYLRGKASDRKLRLFAVACCRRIWRVLADERSKRAVEVLERFADGTGTVEDVLEARAHAESAMIQSAESIHGAESNTLWAAAASARNGVFNVMLSRHCARKAARSARIAAACAAGEGAAAAERAAQVALLRDLFGNPFRSAPRIDPAWLAWNSGTVRKLAEAIYEERAFDRLPVLSDALEDAGCADAEILTHCRSGGAHARGCWVIDLLLEKT